MSSRPSWHHLVVSVLGTTYLYAMGKTSFSYNVDAPSYLPFRRHKKPVVYAFWHNSQVMLAYAHRGEGVNIMVSQSKDGEYIAQVMRLMGLSAVRGSTSRGGEQALRKMVDLLKQGKQAGFTPDGPRGPLHTVHGGVVGAARISESSILPTAALSRRRVVFKSWDRFVLPLPFGVNFIAHGEPLHLTPDLTDDQSKEKIRAAINLENARLEEIEKQTPSYFSLLLGEILYLIYSVGSSILSPLIFLILISKFGWKRSWAGARQRLCLDAVPAASAPRLWFHAASVGEWQALRPVIEKFERNSKFSLWVTTSTPEGQALIRKEKPALPVSLLPLDFPVFMKKWIKKLQPYAVIVTETELWPHLLEESYRTHVPVFVMNGRLSPRSFQRWSMLKPFIRRCLSRVSFVYARSLQDADHFQKLGMAPANISMVGNTKSDNLTVLSVDQKKALKHEWLGLADDLICIGGSTWPGEESALLAALENRQFGATRLILAPRQAYRWNELIDLLKRQKHPWSLWSDVKKSRQWTTRILLVDTFGDLGLLYGASDMAFIGGTVYPRGGQNPLEPAAAGLPLVFGSSIHNFQEEMRLMVETGAGVKIEKYAQLVPELVKLVEDGALRRQRGLQAVRAVQQSQGAAEKNYQGLIEKLKVF